MSVVKIEKIILVELSIFLVLDSGDILGGLHLFLISVGVILDV